MNMSIQYTEEFKKDAVRYWKEHPEIGIEKCAKNLGISKSALSNWGKAFDDNGGTVPTRGRGNFESDEAKEIARLRKKLRDTQDALDILKKAISILGK
jgi:transposase